MNMKSCKAHPVGSSEQHWAQRSQLMYACADDPSPKIGKPSAAQMAEIRIPTEAARAVLVSRSAMATCTRSHCAA